MTRLEGGDGVKNISFKKNYNIHDQKKTVIKYKINS